MTIIRLIFINEIQFDTTSLWRPTGALGSWFRFQPIRWPGFLLPVPVHMRRTVWNHDPSAKQYQKISPHQTNYTVKQKKTVTIILSRQKSEMQMPVLLKCQIIYRSTSILAPLQIYPITMYMIYHVNLVTAKILKQLFLPTLKYMDDAGVQEGSGRA